MKYFHRIVLFAICAVSMMACSTVPAGNAGVKVYLLGGKKGVDHEILGPGRYWMGWNTNLFLFPLFQQNYTWTQSSKEESVNNEGFTFQTKEGMEVGVDVGVTYHVDPDKVGELFLKYRQPLEEITHKFLRNNVRNALNRYGSQMAVEETYGVGKGALFDSALHMVRKDLTGEGILIDQLYLIGTFRLPTNVIASLNAKIAATQEAQKRENEVQTAKAQAEIDVAKAEGEAKARIATARGEAEATLLEAKAVAEAMRLKRDNMTETYVRYVAASNWDGKLPETMTGGAMPFLNIGSGQSGK